MNHESLSVVMGTRGLVETPAQGKGERCRAVEATN